MGTPQLSHSQGAGAAPQSPQEGRERCGNAGAKKGWNFKRGREVTDSFVLTFGFLYKGPEP